MSTRTALGQYLRARRELVDPATVGLRVTGVRRTPGLRREEVATLAGISADYYLRLEQGRDRNPSTQVLDAIAGILGLDATATQYLRSLAITAPAARVRRREIVPPRIGFLLETLPVPAFVESRIFDVLAVNDVASALWPSMVPGQNRMRAMFLDEAERAMWIDWEAAAASMIAGFRTSIGTRTDDPRTAQLVGELSLGSTLFGKLWARHDVRPLAGGAVALDHPALGRIELLREKFPIADTDGQILAIYHAQPGSTSALALAGLSADTPARAAVRVER